MLVASSGSDVPIATRVRPMTAWEMPRASAISVAPTIRSLDPTTRQARPALTSPIPTQSDLDEGISSASSVCRSAEGDLGFRRSYLYESHT
jgi:hypothetical protein